MSQCFTVFKPTKTQHPNGDETIKAEIRVGKGRERRKEGFQSLRK